jgi:hypothetical protein
VARLIDLPPSYALPGDLRGSFDIVLSVDFGATYPYPRPICPRPGRDATSPRSLRRLAIRTSHAVF